MKHMVIMRGLPGSGKSFYAHELAQCLMKQKKPKKSGQTSWDVRVFSADMFMVDKDGNYSFDVTRLGHCHTRCYTHASTFMSLEHIDAVIVDNTNLTWDELSPYVMIGRANDARVTILEMVREIEVCVANNTHGVPEETIWNMHSRFQRGQHPVWGKGCNIYNTDFRKTSMAMVLQMMGIRS